MDPPTPPPPPLPSTSLPSPALAPLGGGDGSAARAASSSPAASSPAGGAAGAARVTRRRPRRSERSLAILLQSLVGSAVVVEMKTDAEARGLLLEADDQMNLVLENVEHVTPRGGQQRLELLYVKGRMIRYVHLSPRVNVGKSIQRHLDSLDAQARRFQRARLKPQQRGPGELPPGANQVIQVTLPPEGMRLDDD